VGTENRLNYRLINLIDKLTIIPLDRLCIDCDAEIVAGDILFDFRKPLELPEIRFSILLLHSIKYL